MTDVQTFYWSLEGHYYSFPYGNWWHFHYVTDPVSFASILLILVRYYCITQERAAAYNDIILDRVLL